ncbi:MAG: CopG family transcriptional regulator [Pyrinomonadaceae bacterium]
MNATLTIELPEEVKATLDKAAREEGVSENAFVVLALRDYLFLRRFRKLRERMIAESEKTYTDEEVFDLIS